MTQYEALNIMKTGANVFLTGEPGSGKTHIVNEYIAYLRSCGVECAITASTGIAATHISGMTIHSWSGIGIKTSLTKHDLDNIASTDRLAKRIKSAKVLIIDEISMLPPYALNMVEAVCRRVKNSTDPFGGLQIIMVGDFFQLPPIMANQANQNSGALFNDKPQRFSYESIAWKSASPIICYLHEQYRQDDRNYLSVLTAIRANRFSEEHLNHLNQRKVNYADAPSDLPKLFSHNVDVDRVNDEMLAKLSTKGRVFPMMSQGPKHLVATLKRGCLSPESLALKIGASIMFTKNSPKGSFANGTVGVVQDFDKFMGYPTVLTRGGLKLTVEPMDWLLEENGEVLAKVTQLPLRLAWAITVHKSQGMSLDGAVVDLASVFEYGQGYVALSRVRRLSGLHLLGWNKRAFEVHPDIVEQDVFFKTSSADDLSAFVKMPRADLDNLQSRFLQMCGGRPGAGALKQKSTSLKKPTGDTYRQTLALWRESKDLKAIVKARGLSENTIITHLEKLGQKGKIKPGDMLKLCSSELLRALPEIHQAFRDLQTDKLGPVCAHFNDRYSFDDLRLARMVMNK
ncbi:AAA family ATPase [Candidatus Falkowbacteria bacterium CG10_big_fil_rev_8_21_14_0_10_37_14]|uniref:AAA family ATPase n=1 Tax=Candidatus Falkowbacteria bacterium CG10_big_fil_rev_8_21_14_0_10_37_14 TaxID=1974561 RepID=A0A2M6WSI2_9BACT|nr:AAA family ATPase [Candidatus Falkowbacteria bacterium]PIT95731.1 MAG: AAA family ATPase [Candidatus Falkowbacteria bacterium CG10_big_fil_rev_8_21_14_0_10_37_14]